MSVLIKGMKMPKEGNETIIRIQPNGVVLDQYGHHLIQKAVPVPKHGRLIDADALGFTVMDCENADQALAAIDDAPTIIPADMEDNDG